MEKPVSGDKREYTPIARRYRRGIIFVAFSMLALYLLVALVYTSRSITSQYIQREYVTLDHTLESLHVLFVTAQNYSKAILSDDIVQDILASPSSDFSHDYITMSREISRYMLSNQYFDAALIYGSNNRLYDSGGIFFTRGSTQNQHQVEKLTWLPVYQAPYTHHGENSPHWIFSMVRPIYDYRNVQRIGTIEMNLAEKAIADSFLINDSGRLFYLVDAENRIISHPDKSLLLTEDAVPLLDNDTVYETASHYTIARRYEHTGWTIKSTTARSVIVGPVYKMMAVLLGAGLLIVFFGTVASQKTARTITDGISQLSSSVRKISGYHQRIPPIDTSDETAILSEEFNSMLDKLDTATTQLLMEQRQKRKFQLELLQQQVNPHFLYNTLENISSLGELGYREQLLDLVDHVARFYRGVLSKGDVLIPMDSELDIAQSYLQILQIRYRSSFGYKIDVDKSLHDNICIKLILQPLLENSISHGFALLDRPGHIAITAAVQGGDVLLQVTDNGKGIPPEKLSRILHPPKEREDINSYGLYNVHQRLGLYFGESYGLQVESRLGVGTTVLLRLPHSKWRKEFNDQDTVG